MAITHSANGSLSINTTTAVLNVTSPAVAVGDYVLVAVILNKSAISFLEAPIGWTEIVQIQNNCTTNADDHTVAVFYKQVTADDGNDVYAFSKDADDNLLFAGIISTWSGVLKVGDIIDAAGVGFTATTGQTDDVSFPAYDPVGTDRHIIFIAAYGNDNTTFAAAMSNDVNPDCTKRFDEETGGGNDCTLALTSGDNDGTNIAARTWASVSTTNAGNTGIVFAVKPEPPPAGGASRLRTLLGIGL